MKFIILFSLSIILYSFTNNSTPSKSQNVSFEITHIRNLKGNFVLCFFNNQSSYDADKECIRKEVSKKNIKDGTLKFVLSLPEGYLGVVLLDDENQNDLMDYGVLLPLEGFGFSNHIAVISKPLLSDFGFNIPNKTKLPITIKVKYM